MPHETSQPHAISRVAFSTPLDTPHLPLSGSRTRGVPNPNFGESDSYNVGQSHEANFESSRPNFSLSQSEVPHYRSDVPAQNDQLLAILQRQNEISQSIITCQDKANLPKREVSKFDGLDITKYKSFIQNFENTIEIKCTNDLDKFLYLKQHVTGKPSKLVNSCSHLAPSIAYSKAKQLLKSEYGNSHKVAHAYVEKLSMWPQIKTNDGEGLQELSFFLLDIYHYFDNMALNNQLNNPREIMAVVNKLPYNLRDRFRRYTNTLLKNATEIQFGDLVKFIFDEVSILQQPIFGNISEIDKTNFNFKKKSLAVSSEAKDFSENYCEYCERKNHDLTSCREFENISLGNKCDFIKRSGICFACLKKTGHFSRDCAEKSTCGICEGEHPTILHDDNKFKNKSVVESTPNSGEVSET